MNTPPLFFRDGVQTRKKLTNTAIAKLAVPEGKQSVKLFDTDVGGFGVRKMTSGQFAPGVSGNPGGRPKDEARVAELARSYTAEAIGTLVELMRHGKDDRVRGTAAQALLERGWGKPKVEVVTDAGGGYLQALQAANVTKSVTST